MSSVVRAMLVVLAIGPGLSSLAWGQRPHRKAEAIADPEWLRTLLEREREAHRLPAVAAAVVMDGKVLVASAVGLRKLGSPAHVSQTDAFHPGSLARPMSATMFGVLVDQGVLRWDMTMIEMFPELAELMQPAYRDVTVAQLLSHTGGFPDQPETSENETDRKSTTATDRRYEYVKAAVEDPPAAPPRGCRLTSFRSDHIISYRRFNGTNGYPCHRPIFLPPKASVRFVRVSEAV